MEKNNRIIVNTEFLLGDVCYYSGEVYLFDRELTTIAVRFLNKNTGLPECALLDAKPCCISSSAFLLQETNSGEAYYGSLRNLFYADENGVYFTGAVFKMEHNCRD